MNVPHSEGEWARGSAWSEELTWLSCWLRCLSPLPRHEIPTFPACQCRCQLPFVRVSYLATSTTWLSWQNFVDFLFWQLTDQALSASKQPCLLLVRGGRIEWWWRNDTRPHPASPNAKFFAVVSARHSVTHEGFGPAGTEEFSVMFCREYDYSGKYQQKQWGETVITANKSLGTKIDQRANKRSLLST